MQAAQQQSVRAKALKRVEVEKILNTAEKLKMCEAWLVTPSVADEAEEEKDEQVQAALTTRKEFLNRLAKDELDLVVRESGRQVRHDDLPIAYRSIKTLLLKIQQKQAGLKNGEFRRNCLESMQTSESQAEQFIKKKIFMLEAVQRAKFAEKSAISDQIENPCEALSNLFEGSEASQDKVLSILISQMEFSDDYLRELERKMTEFLCRTNADTLEKVTNFGSSNLDPNGLAMMVTSCLIQSHYFQMRKILDAESEGEEIKFDKEKAQQVLKNIETLLDAWFVAMSKVLVSKQLQAVREAIGAGDSNLSAKFNSVLTAYQSLASCVSMICLFLCSMAYEALEGSLHKILDSVMSLLSFTQLELQLADENSLKKTLKSLNSLFVFTTSVVAYRMFRQTRDIVNCDTLLSQMSSYSGRKIEPESFQLASKGKKVTELESYLNQNDQIESLWNSDQEGKAPNPVIQKLLNDDNGYAEIIEALSDACRNKAELKILSTNYHKRSHLDAKRTERLPIIKLVLAALVNFHPHKQELIGDLEGNNPSNELALLWADAGDITYHMMNDAKQHAESEQTQIEEFCKKANFLAKLQVNAQKQVLQKGSFQDYGRKSEELIKTLEEKPYKAALQRAVSFGIFKRAIQACDSSNQQDYILIILRWFISSMRSCSKNQISYATGLPVLGSSLDQILKNGFNDVIKAVASLQNVMQDSPVLCEALCWTYMPKDFESLYQECEIFDIKDYNKPWCLMSQNIISCEFISSISLETDDNAQARIKTQLQKIGQNLFALVTKYLDNFTPIAASNQQMQNQDLRDLKQNCKFCSYEQPKFPITENEPFHCQFCNVDLKLTDQQSEQQPNSELIIWQVVQAIDLLMCLALEKNSLDLLNELFSKENFSLILRLASETSNVNQILGQRLIQNCLSNIESINDEFLQGSVQLISQDKPCYQAPAGNLPQFQNSAFLQLLLGQMLRNDTMVAAQAQISKTAKIVTFYAPTRFQAQVDSFCKFIKACFTVIKDAQGNQLTQHEKKAFSNLIPEISLPLICTGSSCLDQVSNEQFMVIGYCQNSYNRTNLHPSAEGTDRTLDKGISLNSGTTVFMLKKLKDLKPLIGRNEKNLVSNSIVFNQKELVQMTLEALSRTTNPIQKSFLIRGHANMVTLSQGKYINFLETEQLLETMIQTVKPIAFDQGLSQLRSIENLQLLAENFMREHMQPDEESKVTEAQTEQEIPEEAIQGLIDNQFSNLFCSQIDQNYNEMFDGIQEYFIGSDDHQCDLDTLSNKGITSQDDCLNQLVALRARQILLTIISEKPALGVTQLDQNQLFQLIFDEHATAASCGYPQHLKEIEDKITQILLHLKTDKPEKGKSFVQELLKRGYLSTQASSQAFRTGSQHIYPGSVPFFAETVQNNKLFDEASMPKNKLERVLYDLMLTMGFSHCNLNPVTSTQLFKAASEQLKNRVVVNGLGDMNVEDAGDFINNKLIELLFFHGPKDYGILFNDKCQSIYQIICDLKSLSQQQNIEFKLVPSDEWIEIEQILETLKEGLKPQSHLFNIERDLLLSDLNARGVTSSWGSITLSDDFIFDNTEISMKFKGAPDAPKTLKILRQGCEESLKVRYTQGNQAPIEYLNGDKIIIQPNEDCQIDITESTDAPSVKFCGWLSTNPEDDKEMFSEDWKVRFNLNELSPDQVFAARNWVMFVTEDEKIYMLGRKKDQEYDKPYYDDLKEETGQDEPDYPDKYIDLAGGELREIQKPEECKNFQKIVHCNEYIVILTKEGKLYINGFDEEDYFPTIETGDEGEDDEIKHDINFKEVDIGSMFKKWKKDKGGKIIDLSVSKGVLDPTMVAIVTEDGKLYAICKQIKDTLGYTEKAVENNMNDFKKICKIDGKGEEWKAEKVFCGRDNTIYYNASFDGKRKTFRMKARADKNAKELVTDTVFEQIICSRDYEFFQDSDGHLWIMGEKEQIPTQFLDEDIGQDSPKKQEWLSERGEQVIGMKAGRKAMIFKTKKLEEGKEIINFYGIPRMYNETTKEELDDVKPMEKIIKMCKTMIGFDSCENVHKGIVFKLNGLAADAENIKDFACGSNSSFIIMNSSKAAAGSGDQSSQRHEDDRINPKKQPGQGLLYYYKAEDGQMKELSQQSFDAEKQTLPGEFCFATHYPIKDKRSINYLSNQWDQAQAQTQIVVQEEESKIYHQVRTTAKNEEVSLSEPLYYSYSEISNTDQKIFATEDEARSGSQIWDLNPLIFYRVTKPIQLEKLPKIDIKQIYNQNRTTQRKIVIIERKKGITQEQIEAARACAKQLTIQRIDQIKHFSAEDDLKIIEVLDEQLKQKLPDVEFFKLSDKPAVEDRRSRRLTLQQNIDKVLDVKSSEAWNKLRVDMFRMDYDQYFGKDKKRYIEPEKRSVIPLRAKMLIKLQKMFFQVFRIINQKNRLVSDSTQGKYFALAKYIMPTLRFQILKEQLKELPRYQQPEDKYLMCKVTINNEDLNKTMISQMVQDIKDFGDRSIEQGCKIFCDYNRKESQPFKANVLQGNQQDEGGAYRQVLTDVVEEISEEKIPLLQKSPLGIGTQILNENCDDTYEDSYKLVGALISFSLLSMQPFNLNLDKSFWKLIVGQKLDRSDLEQYEIIEDSDKLSENEVEIRVQNYFQKFSKQVKAIQQGMKAVLEETNFDTVAYLPIDKFIDRIKGRTTYKMEDLKAITKYIFRMTKDETEIQWKDQPLRTAEEKKKVQDAENVRNWFWEIFAGFDDQMKADYLKFVWGRSRLPIRITHEEHLFKLQDVKLDYSKGPKDSQGNAKLDKQGKTIPHQFFVPDSIPQSHTCFFSFEPPFYTSKEKFREKLLQAMQESQGVED